jgi:uncharacterized Zn ribbon protein
VSSIPKCPACGSEHAYEDGALLVCPDARTNGRRLRRRPATMMPPAT